MFNPVVGVPQNGVQTIALKDKSGVMREVKATPEEVKAFLDKRAEYSKFNKSYILPSIIGAGLAAAGGFLAKIRGVGALSGFGFFGACTAIFVRGIQQSAKSLELEQKFLDTHA